MSVADGQVRVSLGVVGGTFGSPSTIYSIPGATATDVKLGDMNGDGRLDIVTASGGGGGGAASLFINSGSGNFQSTGDITTVGVQSLAIADLNHDGYRDLVMGSAAGGIAVKLGNGDGTFQANTSYDVIGSNSVYV